MPDKTILIAGTPANIAAALAQGEGVGAPAVSRALDKQLWFLEAHVQEPQ